MTEYENVRHQILLAADTHRELFDAISTLIDVSSDVSGGHLPKNLGRTVGMIRDLEGAGDVLAQCAEQCKTAAIALRKWSGVE